MGKQLFDAYWRAWRLYARDLPPALAYRYYCVALRRLWACERAVGARPTPFPFQDPATLFSEAL